MKVRFITDVELEVVDSYEEALDNADAETSTKVFRKGDAVEFDIFGYGERMVDGKLVEDKNFPTVQFGNGSVACLSAEWYEVIGPQ